MGSIVSRPFIEGALRPETGQGETAQHGRDVPNPETIERHVRNDEARGALRTENPPNCPTNNHRNTLNTLGLFSSH